MSEKRRSSLYEKLVRPLLFLMDPEEAHALAHKAMPLVPLVSAFLKPVDAKFEQRLAVTLAGTKLSNPIGLAAGFDKNGKLANYIDRLGFGFAEIGSITGQSCAGNPKPRLFRLPQDEAVINYMGLNGEGAESVANRLRGSACKIPFAINIAKTNNPEIVGEKAVIDFVSSFAAIKDLPVAYVALNVSCPNTHEGKHSELGQLRSVLEQIDNLNQRNIPLFVKLSPDSDMELLEGVVSMAQELNLAGFICGNTSLDRSRLTTPEAVLTKIGPGGMSGTPLKSKALNLCRRVNELKSKEQQIIGCGGISSGEDAFEFIASGATAVQIYTGLVYFGPGLPVRIATELGSILEARNMTMANAVGSYAGSNIF